MGILKVVPILLSTKGTEFLTILDQQVVRFDLTVFTDTVIVIRNGSSVDFNVITIGEINNNFLVTQCISYCQRFDRNRLVVGSIINS